MRRRWFAGRDDEYDGVALEALVKAAQQWSPGGLSFKGFLASRVRWALVDFHRQWHRESARLSTRGRWSSRRRTYTVVSTDVPVYVDSESATVLDVHGFTDPDIADRVVDVDEAVGVLRACSPVLRSRAVRVAAGWSQKEVAAQDGVSPAAVSYGFTRTSLRKT